MNRSIAIVAHDAGAANHIFAWLMSGLLERKCVKLCLAGPALAAYRKAFPNFKNYSVDEVLDGVNVLISGTGWASNLEFQARSIAKEMALKVIAVIDHWSNYEKRFISADELLLPDEIWVVDKYAFNIASNLFPSIVVVQKENDFITEQVNLINDISIVKKITDANVVNVLFVMEPIRDTWAGNVIGGEFQALKFFLDNVSIVTKGKKVKLVIKPHPSDSEGKYSSCCEKKENICITIDEAASLAELIAWSDVVVGCQTYAMVVAIAAGKKVISTLPPIAPPCILPHKEIIHLRELI